MTQTRLNEVPGGIGLQVQGQGVKPDLRLSRTLFIFYLMKILVWNARGLGNRPIVRRLRYMVQLHGPSLVAVLEPFICRDRGNDIMSSLGFDHFVANGDGSAKVWIFSKSSIQASLISSCSQGLTMLIKTGLSPSDLLVSFVYASCCYQERRLLWDYFREVNGLGLDVPWSVVGDFNSVIACSEKKGGRPPRTLCMDEFRECIDGCSLTDVGFAGPEFTWCNNQRGEDRILARLDRCLLFAHNSDVSARVHHLPRIASDHVPLLVDFYQNDGCGAKPFKFLDVWLQDSNCLSIIRNSWVQPVEDGGDFSFRWFLKLKRLKVVLREWSKASFGDIFSKVKATEVEVKLAQ